MANDNVEIQGLEFEFVSNADEATKKVDGLTESLGRLQKALSGFNASPVNNTLHDIQEQADKVDDQKLSKLKETLSRVSAAAKKATSSFEGLGTEITVAPPASPFGENSSPEELQQKYLIDTAGDYEDLDSEES